MKTSLNDSNFIFPRHNSALFNHYSQRSIMRLEFCSNPTERSTGGILIEESIEHGVHGYTAQNSNTNRRKYKQHIDKKNQLRLYKTSLLTPS